MLGQLVSGANISIMKNGTEDDKAKLPAATRYNEAHRRRRETMPQDSGTEYIIDGHLHIIRRLILIIRALLIYYTNDNTLL
jgi:hypothetical protein